MASSNIARLGVILGINVAEWEADINQAIAANVKLKNAIKRENTAAEKEIERLAWAVKDYGREVSAAEKLERDFLAGGKFANATDLRKQKLRELATQYDAVAAAAKKAGTAETGGITAQQKAALGYQTTDVITSLAGGQNPMLVLLQQGGQLKDQFGGFGPMFKGIAGAVTLTGTAMVGLAASIGGVTYAIYEGREAFKDFNNALVLTGNFSGMTYGKFVLLSAQLAASKDITISSAKDIYGALTSSGKFTGESIASVANAVATVTRLSKESADVIVQNLMPSFDGSASSAKRLDEQFHFLTTSQYRQIEALERSGEKQKAIKLVADALNESLRNQTNELGYIATAWKALSDIFSGIKEWGVKETDIQKLSRWKKELEDVEKKIQAGPGTNMFGVSKWEIANAEQIAINMKVRIAELQKKLDGEENDRKKKSAKEEAILRQKELYDRAGGYQKQVQLEDELSKISTDSKLARDSYGVDEVTRIRLKAEHDVIEFSRNQATLARQEQNVFQALRYKIIKENDRKVYEERDRQIKDISRLEFETLKKKQVDEKNSIELEREKLKIYQDNLFITDENYKIALLQLSTNQEIEKIEANRKLDRGDKDKLISNQRELQRSRIEVDKLDTRLKMLKESGAFVFKSMEDAIIQFTRTGKLSFKDLVGTILRGLLEIQMRAQANKLLGMLGSFITSSTFTNEAGGTELAGSLGFADGGSPPVGVPSLVGEKGPELFIPRQSGTIIPNDKMSSFMGNQPQVIYNGPYIASMSAIDTQSAAQFLAKNKNSVWSANQSAARGLPTNR